MTYSMEIEKEMSVRHEGSWGATQWEVATLRITAWACEERKIGGFEMYDLETCDRYYAEGGLWFDENMNLVDYDGVFRLPTEIRKWLEEEVAQ
tara:strand:- start:90 stop:368 length:279 start_codon:yes stop_codon:yes gene_type:complete